MKTNITADSNRQFTSRRSLFLALASLIVLWAGVLNAVCLSGYVRDAGGAPIVNVDLDFIDAVSGVKLITPNDNTDASGFYNVCVLPGVYTVTFAPRRGSHLIGSQIFNVDLSNNQSRQENVTLATGVVIRGTVTDSLGAAIGDIDLDLDSLGAGRVYTGDDNSSPVDGTYWIAVPPGTYRMRFDPLPGTGWRGLQIDTFAVFADTVVDVTMHRGFRMTGTVRDNLGASVPRIDFELKLASGERVFVADNTTDTNGHYQVIVPSGSYELRFVPLSASRFVGVSYPDFRIDGDSVWNQELAKGILITAVVTDQNGAPISGADLDFNIPGTPAKLFTPHDKTDAEGSSTNAVASGIYDLEIDPPPGAPYDRLTLFAFNCENDTSITVQLPEVSRVSVSGQVRARGGEGLPQIDLEVRSSVTGAKLFVQNNSTDQSGAFNIAVPKGALDFYFNPGITGRYVAASVHGIQISSDTSLSPIELDLGLILTCRVIDSDSQLIIGADIDAAKVNENGVVYTPYDKTDQDGLARLALNPGSYNILATPPPGSDLENAQSVVDLIGEDVQVTIVLKRPSFETEELAILHANYPNPFSDETTFKFELTEATHASLKIFTVAGELVATLLDEPQTAGEHQVIWDARNRDGNDVADGVYICLLHANDVTRMLKLVRVR